MSSNDVRSLGVEEELLLVDPETGGPLGIAGSVLKHAHDRGVIEMESELQQQQVELATKPCTKLTDLAAELDRARTAASKAALDSGADIVALGTSPCRVEPRTTDDARYRRMVQRFGLTAREQLTCGCHVHVNLESDEEGVAVLDRIRPWLPVLVALSANSPFWQEQDTGFASYRYAVWDRWPSAGPTGIFGSAHGYHDTVRALLETDTLLDDGMVYFNARLSEHLPTLEIRVADVCLHCSDAVLIAALARGLVDTAAQEWRAGRPPDPVRTELLRVAHWRAARSGLDGDLVHPFEFRPAPARDVVEALVEHVSVALTDNGDSATVATHVDDLWRRGNGATVQRGHYRETKDWSAVVRAAVVHSVKPAECDRS